MLLLVMACVPAGCTSLAERIAVPGRNAPDLGPVQQRIERDMGISVHATRITGDVTLSWRLVPAADRGFDVEVRPDRSFTMGPASRRAPAPLAPKGTIVYLHGLGMDSSTMLFWAMALADHGYHGIAVDLRGHGGSSQVPLGYGTREAGDLEALLAYLGDAGLLQGPVHLFGVSYGATTALMAEARLRDRITGIVALQPFANAAQASRSAIDSLLAMEGSSLESRLAFAAMRFRYGRADRDEAIREAGRLLGLDLAQVDATRAARDSATCTLLLHGTDDAFVPPGASRQLAAKSPLMRLHLLDGEDHWSLPFRIDRLEAPVVAWLAAVEAGACPAFPSASPGPQPVGRIEH